MKRRRMRARKSPSKRDNNNQSLKDGRRNGSTAKQKSKTDGGMSNMSRGTKVSRSEYEALKKLEGSTKAIAQISKRSDTTISMIRKAKSFEEFEQMRLEYSRKSWAKQKRQKKEKCHYGVGEKLVATTTNGTLISLFDEDKEDMVKLFTKPIPKSKAEAIQKALQEAGIGLFEDYFYTA